MGDAKMHGADNEEVQNAVVNGDLDGGADPMEGAVQEEQNRSGHGDLGCGANMMAGVMQKERKEQRELEKEEEQEEQRAGGVADGDQVMHDAEPAICREMRAADYMPEDDQAQLDEKKCDDGWKRIVQICAASCAPGNHYERAAGMKRKLSTKETESEPSRDNKSASPEPQNNADAM